MKKITLALFCLSALFSFSQTLNQPANWPNSNWSISGSYLTDANAFEANPASDSNFAYDDDDAGNGHQDSIAAESPIISLTAASDAGENWLTVGTSYVFRSLGEILQLQYWNADSGSWVDWGDAFAPTTTSTNDDFCSGSAVGFTSNPLSIASFTSNQLTNFQYRFYYDDFQVGGFWGWGFCMQSPTISSQTPPVCPNISGLTVSNVTVTTANVFWQAGDVESDWEVAVQASGLGIPAGSGTATTLNNPNPLSGLSAGTSYEVYVRGFCGGTDYSNWIGPVAFATLNPARVNFTTQSMPIGGYDLTVVDMDGDNLDDIVSASATNVNIHYQLSAGGFNEVDIATTNANFLPGWSMAAADFDRNGKTDLLYGAGNGVTFMKQNSAGTGFTELSGSDYVFSQRSNFVDINEDGHLDAFVCHDVEPNVYYINDGSGNLTFYQSNTTPDAPANLGDYPSGGNYGSIWIDYNNDRNIDMFIAKCGGVTDRRRNIMLTSNGDGTYTENGASLGLDDPMQTWSSSWADYDNDGDMDLFVGASSGTHKLMRNNMDGTFTDVTSGAGVSGAPTGHENVSHDIDNDGYLDILCNGTILYGKGDLTFEDSDSSQLDYKNGSFGDLNNDGFLDAYYNGNIYWNLTTSNNWITINTIGVQSNIDGIGARVELYTSSGVQIRDVRSGEGFEYMSTLNTHFGIGTDAAISHIIIYWPNTGCETYMNPDINQPFNAIEGGGSACSTLGVVDDEAHTSDLILTPTPTKDILTIKTGLELQNAIYNIYDISGRRVMTNSLNNSKTIDVSELSAGNYILSIMSDNIIKNQKFIKQ
ncbi:MAG: FG-GAP-like repeat-containing protein [Psychroserpens sp.]|uniref:FG-GAP-like repeat-containing protein n=1 Tax=Psychroserpens sp. TaxID=2020870 RepID=UPI00300279BE